MFVLIRNSLALFVAALGYLAIGPLSEEVLRKERSKRQWYFSGHRSVQEFPRNFYRRLARLIGRLPDPLWIYAGILSTAVVGTLLYVVWQPFVWKRFIGQDAPAIALDTTTLAIVLALLSLGVGAFGFFVYKLLEGSIRDISRQEARQARYTTFINLAFSYWLLYKSDTLHERDAEIPPQSAGFVDAAKDAARQGLSLAEQLGDEEAKYLAANNVAYHIATKCDSEEERVQALTLGSLIYRQADSYDRYVWKETFVWVLWRLGEDEASKSEARRVLDALLESGGVPQLKKTEWREKYRCLLN